MENVRGELDRLRRGWRAARGGDLALRVHLVVLVAAAFAAFGSRTLGPWPVLGRLEGHWIDVALVAAALVLLGPLLRHLLPRVLPASRRVLARRLDDSMGWQDAADTALGLGAADEDRPVEVFLAAQTGGRLRILEPATLWPRRVDGRFLPRLATFVLVGAFLFFLLAPGVDGLFGERGAGRGDQAGLGTSPEEQLEDPQDADLWQREHARLYLRAADAKSRPLVLDIRWKTDAPLPADYAGTLELLFDGEPTGLGRLAAPAGDEVDVRREVDLSVLEDLAERLTPGRHVAQAVLSPSVGPWRAPLESNRLEIVLEKGGGGDGDGEGEQPDPEREEEPQPQPEPEPPPDPPPSPEGPDEQPTPGPEAGPIDVVDPLVREEGDTVHKEDAIVAVPDPDAGLEPPPLVPLSEALRDFERIVERAMGDERLRGVDREFLLRYFRALRASEGSAGDER